MKKIPQRADICDWAQFFIHDRVLYADNRKV